MEISAYPSGWYSPDPRVEGVEALRLLRRLLRQEYGAASWADVASELVGDHPRDLPSSRIGEWARGVRPLPQWADRALCAALRQRVVDGALDVGEFARVTCPIYGVCVDMLRSPDPGVRDAARQRLLPLVRGMFARRFGIGDVPLPGGEEG